MDNSIFGNPVGIPHRGPVYEGTAVSAPELNSVALCEASVRENKNMELIDAKVGDLYYNTSEHNLYQCVQVNVTTSPRTCTSSWLCISLGPVKTALDNKEDTDNKVEDLRTPASDLAGKYPSAVAVQDYVSTYVKGEKMLIDADIAKKADKTELNNKEDKIDKVTDLSINPNDITHNQYPSAKATADAINKVNLALYETKEQLKQNLMDGLDNKADKSQIGDIETALDNIIAIQNSLIGGGSV